MPVNKYIERGKKIFERYKSAGENDSEEGLGKRYLFIEQRLKSRHRRRSFDSLHEVGEILLNPEVGWSPVKVFDLMMEREVYWSNRIIWE